MMCRSQTGALLPARLHDRVHLLRYFAHRTGRWCTQY